MKVTATWRRIPIRHANGTTATATIAALWNPQRSYEVQLLMCINREKPVRWLISRDALAAGLDAPVGAEGGDYLILPDLSQPDGHAIELVLAVYGRGVGASCVLVLPVVDVREFLDTTFDDTPATVDIIGDLDSEWSGLLGGAA